MPSTMGFVPFVSTAISNPYFFTAASEANSIAAAPSLIFVALAALGVTGLLVKKYYDDEQLKKQEIENLKIEQEAIKKINEAKESQWKLLKNSVNEVLLVTL